MLHVLIALHALATRAADRARSRLTADDGQSTAEYAVVLLGAATVAALLISWAARSGRITGLLNSVLDQVLSRVG